MSKKHYTQDDAIKEALGFVKPSNLPADKYNTFKSYRSRYEKGTLGQKAINNLLEYFGFQKVVHYVKQRKKTNDTPIE